MKKQSREILTAFSFCPLALTVYLVYNQGLLVV